MSALRYGLELDPDLPNDCHTCMLDMIGHNKRVLETGVAAGAMTRQLRKRRCTVVGIEVDEEAAAYAAPDCEELVVANLSTMDLLERFGSHRFDTVVFGDVLEHLAEPLPVLSQVKQLLVPGGTVVASIPNVAHGAVRLALLAGRFEYSQVGLLDETHIRFFTKESVETLFQRAGFVIVEMRRTTRPIFETEIPVDREAFPADVISTLESDPEALTYQFVVQAVVDDGAQAVRRLHEREERRRLEGLRLEAQLAATAEQLAASHRRTQEFHDQLVALHEEKAAADMRGQDFHDQLVALHVEKAAADVRVQQFHDQLVALREQRGASAERSRWFLTRTVRRITPS